MLLFLPEYVVRYFCPGDPDPKRPTGLASLNAPIDWNCDGAFDTGILDADGDGTADSYDINGSGAFETAVEGAEEWTALNLAFQCARNSQFAFTELPPPETFAKWGLGERILGFDAEVFPACPGAPVPMDGVGTVQVALLGNSALSTNDLAPHYTRFMGGAGAYRRL